MEGKEFKLIKFSPKRTFGIELEFNDCPGSSTRHFLKQCVEAAGEPAVTSDWTHNTDNPEWVCKTDSSCGFEIASRVLGSNESVERTVRDIKVMAKVIDSLKDRNARYDNRCGIHVHVNAFDFDDAAITKLLCYWVKFEKTIIDMMPPNRKENTYCPTHHGFFHPHVKFTYRDLVGMGFHQRGALNLGHFNTRRTIEFRLLEMSLDSHTVKNWVRFLLYFMERVKALPEPENVNWMTLDEILIALDLHNADDEITDSPLPSTEERGGDQNCFRILSPSLVEMKLWMFNRIHRYASFPQDEVRIKEVAKRMAEAIS